MTLISPDQFSISLRMEMESRVAGLAGISRQIRGLEDVAGRVGSRITAKLGAAFAAIGGAMGIGRAIGGIIGLQSELQNAEFGMASLINALTDKDIGSALKEARKQVSGLREDAAKGAGELGDYTRAFQQILGPGLAANAGFDEIRELTRVAIAAGAASGRVGGVRLASLDVVQALQQGVSDRTTPIITPLLQAIDLTNEAFNKLGKRKRFDALGEAFGKMAAGADLMGTSWTAQVDTFKDGVKEIIRDVTRPIFERWTEQLEGANKWMVDNRDNMREMAEVWGPRLVEAWDRVIENIGTAVALTGALAGGKLATDVGQAVSQRREAARAAGAAAEVAAVAAQRARGIVPTFAPTGAFGATRAAAARVGGGAAAAVGGGLTLGTMAAGAAVFAAAVAVVGAAFLAVKGAIRDNPELLESMAAATSRLGGAFADLLESISGLAAPGSPIVWLGSVGMTIFITAIDVAARFVEAITVITTAFGDALQLIGNSLSILKLAAAGDVAGARMATQRGFFLQETAIRRVASGISAIFRPIRRTKINKAGDGEADGAGVSGPPVTNIGTVNVTVKAEITEDPNRIAVAFNEVLSRVNEFRQQARVSPLSPKPV